MKVIDYNLLKGKITAMQSTEPEYAYNFLNNAQNPSTEWECIEDMLDNMEVYEVEPVVDCVNREALLKRLNEFNEWCKDGRLQGSLFAVDVIKDMPLTAVQTVKRGKWEHGKRGKWEHGKCTVCKTSLEDLFSGEYYYDYNEIKFCPNCGADMREKE